MALTERSPFPSAISSGNICQGITVGGQHQFTEWQDGSGDIHLVASFAGTTSRYSTDVYVVHHINMTTGTAHLTSGLKGQLGKLVWDSATNRLYLGGSYAGSFGYLNPATGAITSIGSFDYGLIGTMIKGGDGRIYFVYQTNMLCSYNDAEGLYEYGTLGASASDNYCDIGVDATHIYFATPLPTLFGDDAQWTLKIATIGSAAGDFVDWEYADQHDYELAIYQEETTNKWVVRRTLSDQVSYKYYYLEGGVVSAELPGDVTHADVLDASPFCYISATPPANSVLGYDIDPAELGPKPTSQEYSKLGYKLAAAESYTYSQQAYTGPWESFTPGHVVQDSLTDTFVANYASYGPMCAVDHTVPSDSTLGYHQASVYDMIKEPSTGLLFYSGYSGRTARWDTAEAWTLHSGNAIPYAFAAEGKPNPYFLSMARTGIVHHYRFCMDYDANGLIWGGANGTRSPSNLGAGNVWWYDPSDGSFGYVFDGTGGKDDWDDLEIYFRSLCTARTRSKIVVSANDGYLYVVNAADATIDGSYDLAAATGTAGDCAYMVEVADDSVMGVTESGYKFLFKPSDQTMTSGPTDIGLSGYTPFGFSTSSRMKYKLEKGPDGNGWLFMGTRLYKVDASTLAFTLVKSFATYYKIKWVDVSGALTEYDLVLYGNGNAAYYSPAGFYTPGAGDPVIGPPYTRNSLGGCNNAKSVCGAVAPAAVCGGRM